MTTPQVLIIEQETSTTSGLLEKLTAAGCVARSTPTVERARQLIGEARPDLLLVGVAQAGDLDGVEAGKELQNSFGIPVVFLVPAADEKLAWRRGLGACDYLVQPVQDRELRVVLEASLRCQDLNLKLQRTARRNDLLLACGQDIILVLDANRVVRYGSPSVESVLGRRAAEMVGHSVDEFTLPEETAFLQELRPAGLDQSREGQAVELRLLHRDGTWRQLQGSLRNLLADEAVQGLVFNLRDVTECRQAKEQLVRAQRFESVGTLASGIAHDLNNILAPILMGVPLLRFNLSQAEDLELLDTIETSAKRASNIVKQILSLRRGLAGERIAYQPRHVIKEVIAIAREVFPRSMEIEMGVSRELWQVTGDATQLHQAVLNLCINARDAMPGGGKLSVQAENVHVDEVFARMYPEAKPGPYVLVSVTDTGTGIAPEILDRIFDPCFSTKPGSGNGLGLASVEAIVKQHGGFLRVESQVGRGARFLIYLPGLFAETIPPAQARLPAPRGHGELILVVDDEERVREVVSSVLLKHGYRVTTARDGVEGLTCYAQNVATIGLVLTNIGMPNMEGLELIRMLRRINPRLPIVAASGILMHKQNPERAGLGIQGFLLKPFTTEELLCSIDQALRHPEAALAAKPAREANGPLEEPA